MGTSNPDDFTDWSQSKVMWAVRIAGLIVIFVVTVLFIGYICNTKRCGNDNNVNDDEKILYENARVCVAAARLP
ncbi:hypothetical protein PBY51_006452 [Eleginops maclovinus]|uniref:Uncharacterized protein n=1 Tax=Eleginops maclovinus TaxID=56733 RepID=A0AAN7X1M9_ELEMC|nr:hypothetical protein PBY51_006452 [Eleginops maclovinus]